MVETAVALCYEHPSTRFAFVYTTGRSAREIQDMTNGVEEVASTYGNQLGKVDVLPINEPNHSERKALVVLPRAVVERSVLESLIKGLFKGKAAQVNFAWTADAKKVGVALEILKEILNAQA